MEAEALGGRLQNFKLSGDRQRWHGQIATARTAKGSGRIVAGDSDFVFGLDVERFQVVVRDGPIFERAAKRDAVGRAHAEVLRQISPGLGPVAERSSAHAGRVVLIIAFTGKRDVRNPFAVDPDAGIAFVGWSKCISQKRGALIAEVILAAVIRRVPLATFQQHDAEAGSGQLLGDDAARGSGPDDDSIDAFHEGVPFFKSYRERPRIGGSSRPSMCQLTAFRLPP